MHHGNSKQLLYVHVEGHSLLNGHAVYRHEGSHQGTTRPIKLLSEAATCKFLATKQENMFRVNCVSRRCTVSRVIFDKFPRGHTHTHKHTHRRVTIYSNSVMRFLILSPMLPLPLILCYINYISQQAYTVLVVSAPSIHGNSQLVPTLRDARTHVDTHTHSLLPAKTSLKRCTMLDKMNK